VGDHLSSAAATFGIHHSSSVRAAARASSPPPSAIGRVKWHPSWTKPPMSASSVAREPEVVQPQVAVDERRLARVEQLGQKHRLFGHREDGR
jgi:hypothetical protein